ncbi:MAG: hypothetical protein H7841_04245 [Magnetospirillum sp. WYHS-4]
MVRPYHDVKKHWPLDIFWKRKQKAIQEIEQRTGHHGPHHESTPPESLRLIEQMDHILKLLEKKERARKHMFAKVLLGWLVAYSLVSGEVPWFVVKAWHSINHAAAAVGASPPPTPSPP